MKRPLWSIAVTLLFCASMRAQELAGQWQGTLHVTQPKAADLRIVMKISQAPGGGLAADIFSIDQRSPALHTSSFTREGSTVRFAVNLIGLNYEGTLSADGKAISGNWTQGTPHPLDFVLTTKETAWEIPPPPPPPKMMAADADPSIDVATIKPNKTSGDRLQGIGFQGRYFRGINVSAQELIAFAYTLQGKQIVNAPDWLAQDRFDIEATTTPEGSPSPMQLREIVRKLLADRFGLKTHTEQREMSAYVLTVAKGGAKLTKSATDVPMPGFGLQVRPEGVLIPVGHSTMSDFASALQMLIVDRPVVDQTGLTGRYDFTIKFAPDDSQFNGHPPMLNGQIPGSNASAEAAPSLFEALQQQDGLKLTPEKTQVAVLVIDQVTKPSGN